MRIQVATLSFIQKLWSLAAAALFIFFIYYILPRKGFDFTDHGHYLYNSWILGQGVIPTNGYANIANAFFLKLGFSRYLFFEQFFYLAMAGAILFFWSAFKPIRKSWLLPLAILLSVFDNITYMLAYNTGPCLYMLFALGLFYRALDSDGKKSCYLIGSSAFLLSLSAFTNISLIPSVLTTWLLLYYFIRKSNNSRLFNIIYFISAALLLIIYLNSPLSELKISIDHATLPTVFAKIPALIKFIYVALRYPFLLLIVGLSFIFIAYTRGKISLEKAGTFQIALFIAAPIFVLLLSSPILLFYWGAIAHKLTQGGYKYLIALGLLIFYIFILAMLSLQQLDKKQIRLGIAGCILTSYALAMALTTTSTFYSHIRLFVPGFIIVTCLLIETLHCENNLVTRFCKLGCFISLVFLTALAFYLSIAHTYRAYPTFSNKVKQTSGLLNGIYINKYKKEVMDSIERDYYTNHCDVRYYINLSCLPLLYYLFHRRAPKDLAWKFVASDYVQSSQALIKRLKRHQHWCVLSAPGFHGKVFDYTPSVVAFLKDHSKKIITFNSMKSPTSDDSILPNKYRFYVR